jgi:hypothetical protein
MEAKEQAEICASDEKMARSFADAEAKGHEDTLRLRAFEEEKDFATAQRFGKMLFFTANS